MKNRNFIILWIRDALFAAAASLTSTSVLSGHLLHVGMSEDRISFYLAAVPLVNLIVSLLFSSIASKTKKTIPVYSVLCLVSGILTGAYAVLFGVADAKTVMFIFLMILGCLVSGVTAIRNIFDYRLPCEVMNLNDYSFYVSMCGIVGGVAGLAAGAVLSVSYQHFPFVSVTCGAYLAAGICYCVAAATNKLLRRIEQTDKAEKEKVTGNLKTLFGNREFRILFVPNLIRGIGMAVVPMITLLAVNDSIIKETDGAAVTVFTYLATLISCIAYVWLAKRIGVGRLCALGAILFCAIVPAFAGGKVMFYICYTVAYGGYYIINNAVPDMVYRNVNPNLMSIFHTWRLALSTIGTTVATMIIGWLIGSVSPFVILFTGAAAHIVCAAAYYFVFTNGRKKIA